MSKENTHQLASQKLTGVKITVSLIVISRLQRHIEMLPGALNSLLCFGNPPKRYIKQFLSFYLFSTDCFLQQSDFFSLLLAFRETSEFFLQRPVHVWLTAEQARDYFICPLDICHGHKGWNLKIPQYPDPQLAHTHTHTPRRDTPCLKWPPVCLSTTVKSCAASLRSVRGTDQNISFHNFDCFPLQLCHPATTHPHFIFSDSACLETTSVSVQLRRHITAVNHWNVFSYIARNFHTLHK